jgi:ABC-2 type transport system permease protein
MTALFAAGFRHQSSFRFALVSGLATNTFFGLVRTAVFLAVYRSRDEVGGLDVAAALTYVWVLQAVFGILWAPWMQELPHRIRSGEWTAELTRPGPLLPRHLSFELGRTASLLVFRAPIPLLLAALLFDLRLPTTVPGVAAFVLSLVLAGAAATLVRFLVGSIAFWTPDFRGVYALVFGPLYLVSGFVIPVEFFPGALRRIAEAGPLGALLRSHAAVATGRDVVPALVSQVVWIGVGAALCTLVLDRATRRMVAFGG